MGKCFSKPGEGAPSQNVFDEKLHGKIGRDPLKDFTLGKKLGEGVSGETFAATNKKDATEKVALKKIPKATLEEDEARQMVISEVNACVFTAPPLLMHGRSSIRWPRVDVCGSRRFGCFARWASTPILYVCIRCMRIIHTCTSRWSCSGCSRHPARMLCVSRGRGLMRATWSLPRWVTRAHARELHVPVVLSQRWRVTRENHDPWPAKERFYREVVQSDCARRPSGKCPSATDDRKSQMQKCPFQWPLYSFCTDRRFHAQSKSEPPRPQARKLRVR